MRKDRSRRPRLLVAVAVLLALLATACIGGSGGETGLVSGENYSVLGALAEIPESALADVDVPFVVTADVEAASQIAGFERPQISDAGAFVDWATALTLGQVEADGTASQVFVPFPQIFGLDRIQTLEAWRDVAGWDVTQVEAFASMDTVPSPFAVATGAFDEDTLSADLLEVADGVVSNNDHPDGETDIEAGDGLDPLGRGVRFALDGNQIAATFSTPLARTWLAGPDQTLADDESFAAVATALDGRDVLSAILTSSSPIEAALGSQVSPEVLEQILSDVVLPQDPFDQIGIGWGVDEDSNATIAIAYHFADADAAEAAIAAFDELYRDGESLPSQRPISEMLAVDQITSDGSVTVVEAHFPDGVPVSQPYRMLLSRDILFLSR